MGSAATIAPPQTVMHGQAPAAPPAGRGRHSVGPQRAGAWLADAGMLAGLLAVTCWVGVRSTAFVGVPKGGDALDHAATTQLLMENFPHLLWNYAWFGGMPSVPGLYPSGYSLIVAAVVTVFGTSIQHAMLVCGAAAYLVMSASLYGFVRIIARSKIAAGLAGLLVLAAPAFWEPALQLGEYPRLTAMALGCLATFIAALYTKKPSRPRLFAAVVVTGLAFANHPVTGGLGALQVLGVLLFVPYRPTRDRVRTAAVAAAGMGGLAAWLYVPSLVGVHAYYILPQARLTSDVGDSALQRATVADLLIPSHALTTFSPILLPLALLLTAIAVVAARRLRPGPHHRLRWVLGSAAAMLTVVACVLGYAFAGRLTPGKVELVGIYPSDMFSYAAWPLAATSGVLIAGLLALVPRDEHRGWTGLALAVPYVAAAACLLTVVPVMKSGAFAYEQGADAVAPLLPGSNGTEQYRLGLTDQIESSWINVFTRTPEIGGAFNQGALNLDYTTWVEGELTAPPTLAQAKFTAQWSALRWIEAAPAQQGFYQNNPGVFRYVGASATYRNYEVRQPSPVLAATDAPPVLLLGSYDNYNLLLRSLSFTDDGPGSVIPVQGTAYIDDYSLAQLEQFPVLFLYGFGAHDPATAARLLDAYVRAGGGVIADVAGDGQLAAQLADDGAPLPVTSWTAAELPGRWNFKNTGDRLTRGIDLTKFSPALYAGTQPYLVYVAQKRAPGSAVVLQSGWRPLVVTKAAGTGLVVESGINLPYHDAVFSNLTESSLLTRMIQTVTARWPVSGHADSRSVVLGADSARVQAGTADGVLFKVTDTPDWHATVDGHPVSAYPAGLGYMYVRLPGGGPASAAVEFRYQLSRTELASIVLSLLTVVLLLAYLCHVRLPARLRDRYGLEAIALRYGLLSPRIEVQATRERLARLLADPSPSVRRAALVAFPLHQLEPYADLFAARLREESDPSVLEAIRNVVVMHQWEPVASPELLRLRRWAAWPPAARTATATAATGATRVPAAAGPPRPRS